MWFLSYSDDAAGERGVNESEHNHETRIVLSLLKHDGLYNSNIWLRSNVVLNWQFHIIEAKGGRC